MYNSLIIYMDKKFIFDHRTKFGNSRSHAMNISKRSWKCNSHSLTSKLFAKKIKLSVRGLKTINNKFPSFWYKNKNKHEK